MSALGFSELSSLSEVRGQTHFQVYQSTLDRGIPNYMSIFADEIKIGISAKEAGGEERAREINTFFVDS